jgi:glycosyltransferase involved in cell wall biosynthesis
MDEPELAVVMPVYNEEATIGTVLTDWLQALRALGMSFRFLVVNDGSTDRTADIIREQAGNSPQLQVIDKSNSGHGRSCRVGYDTALQQNAHWIFQIDSDGQCDPQFFPQFWNARHDADCVFGNRVTRDDGWMRVFVSFCCRVLLWFCSGSYVVDPNVPYRLMRADVLRQTLPRIPATLDLQNILLALALKKDRTVRWLVVPIHFRARATGASTINLRRIVAMGWEMLTDLKRIG